MRRDVRLALRGFRKNPGFSIVAITTLALGLGATTAIFSVVHGILLNSLPVPQPDRVIYLRDSNSPQFPTFSVSPGNPSLGGVKQRPSTLSRQWLPTS